MKRPKPNIVGKINPYFVRRKLPPVPGLSQRASTSGKHKITKRY